MATNEKKGESDELVSYSPAPDSCASSSNYSVSDPGDTDNFSMPSSLSDNERTNEIDDLLNSLGNDLESTSTSNHDQSLNPLDASDSDNSDQINQRDPDGSLDMDNLAIDMDNLEYQGGEASDPALFALLQEEVEWRTENFQLIHVRQFIGSPDVCFPVDFDRDTASPVDFFHLFFTQTVYESIQRNTNLFFQYKLTERRRLNPSYSHKTWYNVTLEELKAYLGICVIMGLTRTPRYRSYWSSNRFLKNEEICKVFSLKRYEDITEFLHVSNRELEHPRGHPEHHILQKVNWLIEHLNSQFQAVKKPTKHQAVDESLIPFSGRSVLRQWGKPKPCKYGIKVFCRCDSPIGYLQKMKFYLSKRFHPITNAGLTFDTVNDLCREIRNRHHIVFTDNLYTSVPLAKFLYSKGIYLTGTLRSNKKLIPELLRRKNPKLQRGAFKMYQSTRLSNLTACIWRDTSDVKFLSTNCDPHASTNIVRRVARERIAVPSPSIAVTYSKFFSAVDTMDSLITCRNYGGLGHSSKKCWRHIFFWLVNVSISNAFILFKLQSPRYKKWLRSHEVPVGDG